MATPKKTRKRGKDYKPHLLIFKHRKLNKTARTYQHEVHHLTMDLLEINRRIQRSAVLCRRLVDVFGAKGKKSHHIDRQRDLHAFDDLQYHIENFAFRVAAYRDKICYFLNNVLRLGYDQGDTQILKRLLSNRIIKDCHLDTELKKFEVQPLSIFLKRRKLMSHRLWYSSDDYSPYMPSKVSPKEELKKAMRDWRSGIKNEIAKADDCFLKIADINERVSEKAIKVLNKS